MVNWFRGSDMLVHRLVRRGLVEIHNQTVRRDEIATAWVTAKGREAFEAHPDDWGVPDGPRNCSLRRGMLPWEPR